MFERLFTSIRAYFDTSGTVASRSSPEMAGTGALRTGSIFIAMVPPVAMNATTGWATANADAASRQASPASADAILFDMDPSLLTPKRSARLSRGDLLARNPAVQGRPRSRPHPRPHRLYECCCRYGGGLPRVLRGQTTWPPARGIFPPPLSRQTAADAVSGGPNQNGGGGCLSRFRAAKAAKRAPGRSEGRSIGVRF